MLQEIIVDVLDRFEFHMRLFRRHHHLGMASVETIDVVHEFEIAHPLLDAEQIEIRRRDEIDRSLVAMHRDPQVGHVPDYAYARAIAAYHGLPSPPTHCVTCLTPR